MSLVQVGLSCQGWRKREAGGIKLSFLRVPYHLGQGFETPGEPREPECLCFSSSRNNIAMSHYFLASLGQEVWGYVQGSLRL